MIAFTPNPNQPLPCLAHHEGVGVGGSGRTEPNEIRDDFKPPNEGIPILCRSGCASASGYCGLWIHCIENGRGCLFDGVNSSSIFCWSKETMKGGADLMSLETAPGVRPTKYSGNLQVRVEFSSISSGVLARVENMCVLAFLRCSSRGMRLLSDAKSVLE